MRLLEAWWLPIAGCLIAILGARILIIGIAANPTPFWDQWDAEGMFLIRPWTEGTLRFQDLFAAHNEHRVFFTRILSLIILEGAGNWNTVAEMMVNSLIHLCGITAVFFFLRKIDIGRHYMLVAIAALLLFSTPLGAENLLWGFQSQFYLLILFSITAICLLSTYRSFSLPWIGGFLIGAISFLAVASGALTLLAGTGLMAMQMFTGSRQRNMRELVGIALPAMVALAQIAITPVVARHAALHAHSIGQFVLALSATTGWPIILPVLGPIVMNLPTGVLLLRMHKARVPISDPKWRIVGLLLWTGLQAASIAWGRAGGPVASRYVDVFALLPLINLIALLVLHVDTIKAEVGQRRPIASELWLAAVAAFAILNCAWLLPGQPAFNAAYTRAQVANVQRYVASGDATVLSRPDFTLPSWRPVKPGAPNFNIPYYDPARLAAALQVPGIRGTLPAMFGTSDADRQWATHHLLLHGGLNLQPNLLLVLCRWLGGLLLGIGLAVLVVSQSPFQEQRQASPNA